MLTFQRPYDDAARRRGVLCSNQRCYRGSRLFSFFSNPPLFSFQSQQILNHMKLDHPYVIKLDGFFRTDLYLVLILEYAEGGSLRNLISSSADHRLPEAEARRIFQELILAVDYCHRMGISSRDIKPDNILLNAEKKVLLADFGYSKEEDAESLAQTRLGTPAYAAPEIFKSHDGGYDPKQADIWSCAVTLFQMVTGVLPFDRHEDSRLTHSKRGSRMQARLMNGDYIFPPNIPLSDNLKDLLSKMLVADPANRYCVREVTKHPWFLQDLQKGALMINKMLVQESKQMPPDEQAVETIRKMIQEAQTVVGTASSYMGGAAGQSQNYLDMEDTFSYFV